MKKILWTGWFCVLAAAICPAALLTSFSDDFNRPKLGQNYEVVSGAPYEIHNKVMRNGSEAQNQTYLTLGTLPSAEDYAAGYGFTASLDIFIPPEGQASVVTAGLVLNEQDLASGKANRIIRFRGYAADSCSVQLMGAEHSEGANMKALESNAWYTLKVSSASPGVYHYTFSQRDSGKEIANGTFTEKQQNILTGGHIGIYTENAPAETYQLDNFSVTVEKMEPVARPADSPAAAGPAARLASFTDDFNRAEIGGNYRTGRGVRYEIRNSQVLTNGGNGTNFTYLTVGTLPTAEDYAEGFGFTASLDIFIPPEGQATLPTAGLVLHEQDIAKGSACRLLRFRGHGPDSCSLQLMGVGRGQESANMKTLESAAWYTLKVTSALPGVYQYTFSRRDGGKVILQGRFVETEPDILAGGHIGFYAENAPAGTCQFDNFSVVVEKKEPVKIHGLLLFSDALDIADTWGKIHFGTTPLQLVRTCENPGFELSCCLPREDGTWDVYGLSFQKGPESRDQVKESNTWKIHHATTRDGSKFENVETVYESEPAPWTFNHAMAYNPEAREFMLLKLKMDDSGFRYTAFFSPDGRTWREHPGNPLFYDGDAISLFWSPKLHRFIMVSKSLQPVAVPKHIADHGGKNRRVLSIRSSPDGRTWEPSESMEDVWNRGKRWKPLPDALLTVPDAEDPPDLEFYSGNGFWHHDRAYMMVLNYAASPQTSGHHGHQMDTEWWAGRDGLHWERPGRDVNASGPEITRLTHNPMIIKGRFLFHYGNRLLGMKQDRVSYVGARANAEFSTVPFPMPAGDLLLNAAAPAPERAFATQQAYIMVSVLDETGTVVPGFEADKCLITNADEIDLPLLWSGRSARELAGKTCRLHFQLRSANIYAVTVKE